MSKPPELEVLDPVILKKEYEIFITQLKKILTLTENIKKYEVIWTSEKQNTDWINASGGGNEKKIFCVSGLSMWKKN